MIEIEKGSANIYEDLGLPDAAEMQVKATLAAKIGEIIKHRHLTQTQAAEILCMPQPKLSGMLRGQFRGISEAKMRECLNRLGQDVEIVVRTASAGQAAGRRQAAAQLGRRGLRPLTTVVEKRATFACTPGLQRPAAAIAHGLWAAGDYVEGPYPATLEGAVRSGIAAVGL